MTTKVNSLTVSVDVSWNELQQNDWKVYHTESLEQNLTYTKVNKPSTTVIVLAAATANAITAMFA